MLYMTRKNLSKEFQISPRTVDERLKEIEAQIELGRYGRHSIIRDVGYVSCNPLVFADYLTYRQALRSKCPSIVKSVPKFDAYEARNNLGIAQPTLIKAV